MRAGDIDRRIAIQRVTLEPDGGGGHFEVWTDIAVVWAQARQESGREFLAAGAIQAERKVVFRLRWLDGLAVSDRVVHEGRNHDIHEVRELSRREGLELHTTTTD